MKKNLIKVYKKLKNGTEVELLADESQLEALAVHSDFRIPESKEVHSPKKKNQEEEVQT
ncbi:MULTISPECIES: hypothetical protein [Leptospira]|uniref:Uncharacterized protein n=1 Tax=Leptospira santarosai serovar Arenal str. MAVJ 401 TaxID=1049976 RepID=M6JZJ5_9LEPT|nr:MULTISPECIES: hypothetical protein [Leptospira]EKO77243.1 hypothetical protein LEP1GSC068_0507 [Leptospira sp. Fiocruz LV3954]EKR91060.1 hypothetical protein LEP1GSC163_3200 [Leptospira santarosai str. CBC379]EMI68026.1 hypothetical protein LEP1GSC076_0198 [Leptospira sp. Fiocruz LV4135]EMJ45837.1 hypothetical protein LEP1GSC169_0043 [Leptospira santarosai str. HAI1349]EMN20912.1 hypothetical protein LEP1GSC063_3313 [Leptospira santarosai serovar Arenal str. MAVJ 401]